MGRGAEIAISHCWPLSVKDLDPRWRTTILGLSPLTRAPTSSSQLDETTRVCVRMTRSRKQHRNVSTSTRNRDEITFLLRQLYASRVVR